MSDNQTSPDMTPEEAARFRGLVLVAVRDGVDDAIEPYVQHFERRLNAMHLQLDVIIRALQMMAEGEELSTSPESDHVDMSGRPIL